ncbi:MAG TPA: MBL fold metallo-hydrolase [Thermoanaerobaculia bacterium]|nr:MBL fold metallo-hydrolase [Thermoanaerobaculia bacterium]
MTAAARLTVTLTGTGTSTGVPRIACDCAVCTSPDPRNRRLRAGVRIDVGPGPAGPGGTVLVDTSPDLRQQALAHDLRRVDAVLFTHAHADHIYGLDDLRIFNFLQRAHLPLHGSAATLDAVRRYFAYAFEPGQQGGGKPRFELRPVRAPFEVLGQRVVPVPVLHGEMEVFGYRLGGFALVTDVNHVPESSLALLGGLEVLVLGALRYRPHPTHFHLEEAIAVAGRIGARRTLFTHLCHDVDHAAPAVDLPPGVELAHDGLRFEVAGEAAGDEGPGAAAAAGAAAGRRVDPASRGSR